MWYTLDGFQSTPPRGGRHEFANTCTIPNFVFQSTPPARGATYVCILPRQGGAISIHAPREGGDAAVFTVAVALTNFNPRPPRGGRPHLPDGVSVPVAISIHAPREGGDESSLPPMAAPGNFNPRPPRGGRPPWTPTNVHIQRFQSTPPARGATGGGECLSKERVISIHAPREGGRHHRRMRRHE